MIMSIPAGTEATMSAIWSPLELRMVDTAAPMTMSPPAPMRDLMAMSPPAKVENMADLTTMKPQAGMEDPVIMIPEWGTNKASMARP
jgi:hypothetical protein